MKCTSSAFRFLPLLTALLICGSNRAHARLGETSLQFIARYGPPKDTPSSKSMDKDSPLLEGAIHHVYEYRGWKIRAAFLQLDGPAVRVEYSKMPAAGGSSLVRDYELQAIMTANTPAGTAWTQFTYDNSDSLNKGIAKAVETLVSVGQKMWRRTDGAILWSRGDIIIRLDLPAAREYERRLKLSNEQKARASVPQF